MMFEDPRHRFFSTTGPAAEHQTQHQLTDDSPEESGRLAVTVLLPLRDNALDAIATDVFVCCKGIFDGRLVAQALCEYDSVLAPACRALPRSGRRPTGSISDDAH